MSQPIQADSMPKSVGLDGGSADARHIDLHLSRWTGWTLVVTVGHDDSTINIVFPLLLLLSSSSSLCGFSSFYGQKWKMSFLMKWTTFCLLQGVDEYSEPVGLDDNFRIDLIIVGCVAVSPTGMYCGWRRHRTVCRWCLAGRKFNVDRPRQYYSVKSKQETLFPQTTQKSRSPTTTSTRPYFTSIPQ